MLPSTIWLKYQIDNKPWSKETIVSDVYLLPEEVPEYYRVLRFEIRIDAKLQTSTEVTCANVKIARVDAHRHKVVLQRDHSGMLGTRQLELQLFEQDASEQLTIRIPITPQHLQEAQFQAMLNDLSHWLFTSLTSQVKLEIRQRDRFSQARHPHELLLQQISQSAAEIEQRVQQIAHSPKKQILKEYYQTTYSHKPQDRVTLQRADQYPSDLTRLTFRNTTSYDIYENQFILFFLHRLTEKLNFLQPVLESTLQDLHREIKQQQQYKQSSLLAPLQQKAARTKELIVETSNLQQRFKRLRTLEFLKDITFSPGQFQLHFSLTLTQDFYYSRLFALYRELGNNHKKFDQITRFIDALTTVGVKETYKIYEYWTFFAIYHELARFRFYPKSEDELLQAINTDLLNPNLKTGSCVTLVGDKTIYGDLEMHLYYEKEFKPQDKRPDVTLEVFRERRLTARFIFDAKYKSYTGSTGMNSLQYFWEKDFVQIQDYQKLNIGLETDSAVTAFLMHIQANNENFENYGAIIQQKENGAWQQNAHRYGFIPVVPGNLIPLRTLLTMLFLVKLRLDVSQCWVCGSTDIRKGIYHSKYGTEKENQRICNNCSHEWWIQKCRCGFPLFKGRFSFQVQHKLFAHNSSCDGYICPRCGQCVCRETVVKAN